MINFDKQIRIHLQFKLVVFLGLWMSFINPIISQVGIGTITPNASLEIAAANQASPENTDGILIPKIDNFPSVSPTINQDGMLVFATGNSTPTKGFYYWDNTNTLWVPLTASGGAGGNTLDQAYDQGGNGLGKNINATDGAVRINGEDGFLVVGTLLSGNTIDAEVAGAGTRMFFNPSKGAFRAGTIVDFPPILLGDEWNDANIGINSIATGFNTRASGDYSTALGGSTTASGNSATAFGSITTASGINSTAFGYNTSASGNHAIAFGYETSATQTGAISFGGFTTASGVYSTAFGFESVASGLTATAFGNESNASGDSASAFGSLTTASGLGSTAFGSQTTASNEYATAFGFFTTASGIYSTAFGIATNASEDRATAFGVLNQASGDASTAFGSTNTASGDISTAFGHQTSASGTISTAFGHQNTASGEYATAFGRISTASGTISTTFGMATEAPSYGETAIGIYNTLYTPTSTTSFNASDRLFSVGNGSFSTRSNALTIYKNGLININDAYNLPLIDGTVNQVMTTNGAGVVSFQDVSALTGGTLDQAYDYTGPGVGKNIEATDGAVRINGDDGFLVTGSATGAGNIIDAEVTGAGIRMFFNPSRAALRAGLVSGNQWDNVNIGTSSIAMGNNTIASGNSAIALGSNTVASGSNAIAMGSNTTASAIGSLAFGSQSSATGFNSNVIGVGVTAPSYGETVVGVYNTQYTPASNRFFNSGDRLFVVGNGTNASARSNALTIYKDGLVHVEDTLSVGTNAPTANLSVNGTANKPGGGSWAVFSDKRLKKNISRYKEGLDLILKVNPVSFSYNQKMASLWGENSILKGQIYQGVIAQELKEIAPDMVREIMVASGQFFEVDPNKFTYALINAIKEQQQQLVNQQQEIDALKQIINIQLAKQTKEMEALVKQLKKLK